MFVYQTLNVKECSDKSTAMGFVEEFVDLAFESNRNESGKGWQGISYFTDGWMDGQGLTAF